MPTAPAAVATGLRVHLLGGFRVAVDGRAVAEAAWRRRAARGLVKLLALAPGHRLHREQAQDTLWPDLDPAAAAANLDRAVHFARRALDGSGGGGGLRRTGDLLALSPPGGLWVDVDAFEAAAAVARRSADPADGWAAVELYAGELLPEDAYVEWAADRREALRAAHLALLLALAERHEARREPARAIAALQRAVAAEPAHEAAHRELMRQYAAASQGDRALEQYRRLRAALARDLDAAPDAASQRLYAEIVASRPAVAAAPAPASLADAAPPPSAASPSPPPSNLPLAVTSFVGRERELAEVRRLLATTRLLTLTGAGGVGKTRLALELAGRVHADFHDGVRLVELAALADPALVPQAAARALGVPERPGRPLTEALVAWLRDRALLLVLDNCEHLLGACAALADALLRSCPRVRLLATSREALTIAGETAWRVPSLSAPDRQRPLSPAEMARFEAVRLFVDRAGRARPGFALTAANTAAVAQVCAQLDGLPLAIELAAARVTALAMEQIAARLDDRFRLLTGGGRTALPRQQTLRATLDWSDELLTGPERVVFRRLAVFAGGWTLEAAEAVCSGEGIAERDVLDLLARLVDKSLVVADEGDGAARFRLLETVRQYAAEKLADAGEAAATRDRHAAWCLARAERAEPQLVGADQRAAYALLDAERDNLRAALAWSLARDPDAGLRLAGSLQRYWYAGGYGAEGLGWFRALLAASSAPTPARVKALHGAGLMTMALAGPTEGVAYCLEAAALGRALGETARVAWALRDAGQLLERMGAYDRAEALLAEAQALSRALGDARGVGSTLKMQAAVAIGRGDLRRARRLTEEGLAQLRAFGDRELLVRGLLTGSAAALGLGDADGAQALVDEALAVTRALGSSRAATQAWWRAGDVALWRGDLERAAACYEAGLGSARDEADAWSLGQCLAGLGRVALHLGDSGLAIELLGEGLAQAARAEHRPGTGAILLGLALAAHRQGEAARARALLAESLALRRELGQRLGVAECLEGLARVAAGSGEPARAARLIGAADALRADLGAPLPPVDRPDHEATATAARAALGEAAFAAARAAGRALTPDEAVVEALADAPESAGEAIGTPAADGLTTRAGEAPR